MGKKAGLTLADVVGVATALADRHGLDGLTLADVAAELGVRSPSLYNHIDGIDGLRLKLALRAGEVLADLIETAHAGREGEAAFVEMCRAYRRFGLDHPGLYGALTQGSLIAADPEVAAATMQLALPVMATLREMGFEDSHLYEVLRMWRAALHGFIALELDAGFGWDLDVDDSYDHLVTVLIHGLKVFRDEPV